MSVKCLSPPERELIGRVWLLTLPPPIDVGLYLLTERRSCEINNCWNEGEQWNSNYCINSKSGLDKRRVMFLNY